MDLHFKIYCQNINKMLPLFFFVRRLGSYLVLIKVIMSVITNKVLRLIFQLGTNCRGAGTDRENIQFHVSVIRVW